MKTVKKIGIALLSFIIILTVVIFLYLLKDKSDKYEFEAYDESQIPQFTEAKIPFKHSFDAENSLPMVGSAMIDIDGDGIDELFIGGGNWQSDALLKYKNGKFEDISKEVGLEKTLNRSTFGVAIVDMTNDSLPDMLVAREGSVFLYENFKGRFAPPKDLNLTFNEKSEPVAITVADLNNDGNVDLFVSTYLKKNLMEGQTIFNKVGYGSTSKLFLNNGDNSFKDITSEAGLDYTHNTFTAVFVDFNNDNFADLVVAHDTGEPRIYKNLSKKIGDPIKFEKVKLPFSGLFSYPMGIAVGDYDNNGLQDVFFSNVGKSLPAFMLRGDLEKNQTLVTDWILLANQGDFRFESKSEAAKVANYEFSWGAIFEDFNLDGLQDLVVSENYVDLPNSKVMPLPSRFLMQLPNHTFVNIESKNNTQNPYNGISPLISDFNNDGYPDLIHINLGQEPKAFISKVTNQNYYLKIKLPETPAFLNATITIEKADGTKISLQKVSGEGLVSDQSHTMFIGLGNNKNIKSSTLKLTNGTTKNLGLLPVNITVNIR